MPAPKCVLPYHKSNLTEFQKSRSNWAFMRCDRTKDRGPTLHPPGPKRLYATTWHPRGSPVHGLTGWSCFTNFYWIKLFFPQTSDLRPPLLATAPRWQTGGFDGSTFKDMESFCYQEREIHHLFILNDTEWFGNFTAPQSWFWSDIETEGAFT